MIMRINWGRIKDGTWSEYEQAFRNTAVARGGETKGLMGRWLVRDIEDGNAGFSVSLWDSKEDVQAYEQSGPRQEILAALQPFYVDDFSTHLCEVRIAEEFGT